MTKFSLAVISYNQERWVEQAVRAALSQECEPIEIVLSDDCSSDRSFEIMSRVAETYDGPHNLILNRNAIRQGIGGHVRRVAELSSGDWLLLAAGDDLCLPKRVAIVAECVQNDSQIRALETGIVQIDENGEKIPNAKKRPSLQLPSLAQPQYPLIFAESQRIQGCAAAWHREVFDRFPKISNDLVYEDIFLTLRARLLGTARIQSSPETMCYRLSGICSQYQSQSNVKLEAWYTEHFKRLSRVAELFLEDAYAMPNSVCAENLQSIAEEGEVAKKLSMWWSLSTAERRELMKTKCIAESTWYTEWCGMRQTAHSRFQLKLKLMDLKQSIRRTLRSIISR